MSNKLCSNGERVNYFTILHNEKVVYTVLVKSCSHKNLIEQSLTKTLLHFTQLSSYNKRSNYTHHKSDS